MMSSMASAKGSLPGYELRSLSSENLGPCIKDNLDGDPVVTIEAYPVEPAGAPPLSEMQSFLITYYEETGQVEKECSVESYTKYKLGCSRDFATRRVCIRGGANNCTQWIEVPVQSVGNW